VDVENANVERVSLLTRVRREEDQLGRKRHSVVEKVITQMK
jgi:hypothetical protein